MALPIVIGSGWVHDPRLAGPYPSLGICVVGRKKKALSGFYLVIRYAESCSLPSPQLDVETEPIVAEEEKEGPNDVVWLSRAREVTSAPTLPNFLSQ